MKPGSTYSIGVLSKTSSYGQTNRIHVTTLSTPEADEDVEIVENEPLITLTEQTPHLNISIINIDKL